jgi:hypothetical protein
MQNGDYPTQRKSTSISDRSPPNVLCQGMAFSQAARSPSIYGFSAGAFLLCYVPHCEGPRHSEGLKAQYFLARFGTAKAML